MLFLSVYPPPLHTYLSQSRHSLFPLCLFQPFAVIDSLRRKGKMASSWNGRVDDFGNTTLSANTHMHTPITCRSCQSFSGWIVLYFLPYGGNDHMSSRGYTRGCVRVWTFACAYVCSTPPCNVLFPSVCMCPFKQGERLLVGLGERIVNRDIRRKRILALEVLATLSLTSLFKIRFYSFSFRMISGMHEILSINLLCLGKR